MGARDRERDGPGHPLAGAGHRAPDGDGEELAEPARVHGDPVGPGLVGEVEGDDHREAQVAAGDDEREVAGDVAGVDDDEDRVRRRGQERRPERRSRHRAIAERARPRQVDEEGPAGPRPDLADLAAHRRAGRVGRLGEASAGPGQERGLADVRPPDEGDDRQVRRGPLRRAGPCAGRVAAAAGAGQARLGVGRDVAARSRGAARLDEDRGGDPLRERHPRPAEPDDHRAAQGQARLDLEDVAPVKPLGRQPLHVLGRHRRRRARSTPAASSTRGTGGDASTRRFHRLGLACVSAHRPAGRCDQWHPDRDAQVP